MFYFDYGYLGVKQCVVPSFCSAIVSNRCYQIQIMFNLQDSYLKFWAYLYGYHYAQYFYTSRSFPRFQLWTVVTSFRTKSGVLQLRFTRLFSNHSCFKNISKNELWSNNWTFGFWRWVALTVKKVRRILQWQHLMPPSLLCHQWTRLENIVEVVGIPKRFFRSKVNSLKTRTNILEGNVTTWSLSSESMTQDWEIQHKIMSSDSKCLALA